MQTLHSCEGTTQGDPLAMAMYTIGILPIVHQLQSNNTKQTWFADDATDGGCVDHLHHVMLAPPSVNFPILARVVFLLHIPVQYN